MMILTPEETMQQWRDRAGAAEGAGKLLAALLPALAVAETVDGVADNLRNDLNNQVAELLSTTRGFVEKFQRSL